MDDWGLRHSFDQDLTEASFLSSGISHFRKTHLKRREVVMLWNIATCQLHPKFCHLVQLLFKSVLRWNGTLKFGNFHEKLNFLEIQHLRPLSKTF